MNCQCYAQKPISARCLSCEKFICEACHDEHQQQRHRVESMPEIIQNVKWKLQREIEKLNAKISQLDTLADYESGERVIEQCMKEIISFVHNLFQQLKNSYRRICDSLWKNENNLTLDDLNKKKHTLVGWKKILKKEPSKAIQFEEEHILEGNRLDSDEELIQSSRSYLWAQNVPKITYNEIALRRLNENIGQILSIGRMRKEEKIKTKNQGFESVCKFVEGTNLMYEYILNDPDNQEMGLRRINFREFITPMRSVSISLGANLYTIGGHTKEKRPNKEIWVYERNYNIMRVMCLLKRGRFGHTVCHNGEKIYVFGGAQGLEEFDPKKKKVEEIISYDKCIVGASSCIINDCMYVFGGRYKDHGSHNEVIKFNLEQRKSESISPINHLPPSIISPIVQGLNQGQIVILGGYYEHDNESYNNTSIQIYNIKCNYLSRCGKGEQIYPMLHGNTRVKDKRLVGIVELRRQRHIHGPNLPILFEYDMKDDRMQISTLI